MKPTQEQIEAALQTSDEYERRCGEYHPSSPLIILAAAYRELKEAINITIIENLHLADGDDCTLKRLKDAIKFQHPEEP
jgi:hypothetical protein